MESPDRSERRKILIVDVKFQLRYSILVSAVATIISSIAAWFLLEGSGMSAAVLAQKGSALLFILAPALITGSLLFVLMVILTHRVAGPLYVIRRALETLSKGSFPVKRELRLGDQFEDIYELVFAVVQTMREKEVRECAQLREMLAYLPPLSSREQSDVIARSIETLCENKSKNFSIEVKPPH